MPIQVQCQGCGRQFQAADRLAGQRARCPHCSAVIAVPADGPPPTAQARSERASQGAPAGAASGSQEAAWYVQTSDGRQHGPITQAQLERLIASGRMDIFCRLRHRTWSEWKWAEDLFPQLAQSDRSVSTSEDAQHAAGVEAPPAASGESTVPRPRVVACPDCGNMVSTRASQCPHCGCPAAVVAEQAAPTQAAPCDEGSVPTGEGPPAAAGFPGEPGLSREPAVPGSKWASALVVHAAAALLLVAVAGLGVGWWLWKSKPLLGPYESEAEALLNDLSVPTEPLAVSPEEMPALSSDEMEAAMQQAAAEAAKRLDAEFRAAHSASTLMEQTQLGADLIQALAQGDLDAIPDTLPAAPAPDSATSYQSLYDTLYAECLAYLRENVSRSEFSKQAVSGAARRWEQSKRALLEKQLTEELQKYVAPGGQLR